VKQFSGYPVALGLSAVLMTVMSLLPGIPMLPFLALAAGAGYLARRAAQALERQAALKAKEEAAETSAAAKPADEPISTALAIDDLEIELGYALLPLINTGEGSDRLSEQIKALRRQLAAELGFVMPSVRILDNMQLDANAYYQVSVIRTHGPTRAGRWT
jgi:flagellar biosynthesis protein FlhA